MLANRCFSHGYYSTPQPGGVFALGESLFARSLKRSAEADLGNLKDLLESRAGIASSEVC
ncbi:MAG: hypothetical protein NVSMB49_25460 [Ktedonobacteraceae bacterium]